MESVCKELVQFLQLSTRPELKLTATKNVVSLTASPEGRKFIIENKSLLEAILILTKDEIPLVVGDCYNALVNLSAEEHVVDVIVKSYNIIPEFLRVVCDPESEFSHKACMVLSNLTRTPEGSESVVNCLPDFANVTEDTPNLNKLIDVFCKTDYNKHNCNLEYLGTFLANLNQISQVRKYFLDPNKNIISKLFAFFNHTSIIRKGSVAALIRNCCFEYDSHEWLLDESVDILPHVLLPLAGPEEFSDEENDQLPLDLQYLPPDKRREEDPDIVTILLEIIFLLCADKPGRLYIKSKKAYLIIRELHTWSEKYMSEVSNVCEKLIQVLISEEPEDESAKNLMTCIIPDKYKKLLEKADTAEKDKS